MPVLPISASLRMGDDGLSLVHGVVCNVQFLRVYWEDGVPGGKHCFSPLVSPETGLLRFAPAVQALS